MAGRDDIPFTWADAWLLQAIAMAGRDGPAALADVIGAGDALNHAIFTFEELDGGLARLRAAGLIATDDGLHAAPEVRERIDAKSRGMWDERDMLRDLLGADEWSKRYDPRAKDPAWTAGLERKDFEVAVAAYHRDARRAPGKGR
jgi:hypothetical protein